MEKKIPRKEQIEVLATQMFEHKGFSATSMRNLALALDMEASSLYSHIRSKEELLQNICFKMAEQFFAAIEGIESLPESADKKLRKAIVAHVMVITRQPSASAVFFTEWRHLKEPSLSRFLDMQKRYETIILKLILAGIEDRSLIVPEPKLTVLTLLSSLNWIHRWYRPTGSMSPAEIGEKLADLILNGIINKKTIR